jgi:hypothetical protein
MLAHGSLTDQFLGEEEHRCPRRDAELPCNTDANGIAESGKHSRSGQADQTPDGTRWNQMEPDGTRWNYWLQFTRLL